MGGVLLAIQVDASAPAGSRQLEMELLRHVVAAMYADGVVGGSSSCMLAGLEKSELQHWNDAHGVIPPLDAADYQLERRNLSEWLRNA
jgi:hypothetical protein